MKTYLILMYGDHSLPANETEKMEHYGKWGKYLTKFSNDCRYLSGGSLHRCSHILSGNDLMESENNRLDGYMILQADNEDELRGRLSQVPIAVGDRKGLISIHQLDPQSLF